MGEHLTALVGYLAAWEDREGTMAAMMPHEHAAFMEGLKTLAIRHSPREARNELRALSAPEQCPLCKGTGKTLVTSFVDSSKQVERSCPICKGRGVPPSADPRPEQRVAQRRDRCRIITLGVANTRILGDRRKPTEQIEGYDWEDEQNNAPFVKPTERAGDACFTPDAFEAIRATERAAQQDVSQWNSDTQSQAIAPDGPAVAALPQDDGQAVRRALAEILPYVEGYAASADADDPVHEMLPKWKAVL